MLGSFLNKVKNLIIRQDFKDYRQEYDSDLVHFFMSDGYEALKKRYVLFNNILLENNAVLNIVNDLQEKVSSHLITFPYFKKEVSKLLGRVLSFVLALNEMSPNRYDWLIPIAENLKKRIEHKMETEGHDSSMLMYDLEQISALMADDVGGKAANLGEAKNLLNLPVPKGIVFSTLAYKRLLEHNRLDEAIAASMAGLEESGEARIQQILGEIREKILASEVPPDLEEAFSETFKRMNSESFFAVRSSAVGEDGTYSFAGQYHSILNVTGTGILDAFKAVCASLYEERAVRYRWVKGIGENPAPIMAVLVMEMVPAMSAGVLYTLDPNHPDAGQAVISAVRGLGKSLVDGRVSPDLYVLNRETGGTLVRQTIGDKHLEVRAVADGPGIQEMPVPTGLQEKGCLTEEDLHHLYEFGQLLEKYFGTPQDIEWAIDEMGWVYILQTRPLGMAGEDLCPIVEVNEVPMITGDIASPGIASGPVVLVRDRSVSSVPKGSILVLKNMEPEFAKLVPMASGLIAEMGSPTTHLATVAREFLKPALINAKNAMEMVRQKEIVTLDANRGRVYKGRIDSLLKTKYCEVQREAREEKNLPLIRSTMRDIVPLTLTDIPTNPVLEIMLKESDFNTIHDIIRYIHEVSVREMFRFGGRGKTGIAHILIVPRVPLEFYIIDIGEGLDPQAAFRRRISMDDIRSTPFLSLHEGMIREGVSWAGPVEFNLAGFFSVVSRSFIKSDVTDEGGKAYVLLSKDYLNFHSRLAYHFAVIDTLCSEIPDNNYLSFRFGGGGAGVDGRVRRALLLKDILESLDFRVDIKGDLVTTLFRGGTRQEICTRLEHLGRLMGFTRQLDMALQDEDMGREYAKAFFDGAHSIFPESIPEKTD
jgi:pyruvate, water dikinase